MGRVAAALALFGTWCRPRRLWGGCINRIGKDSSGGDSGVVAKETLGSDSSFAPRGRVPKDLVRGSPVGRDSI